MLSIREKKKAGFRTNIQIWEKQEDGTKKVLKETENTFVNSGKLIVGQLLISTGKINRMVISDLVNSGVNTSDIVGVDMAIDRVGSHIDSVTGEVVLSFEIIEDKDKININTIRSLGLRVDDTLVTIADTGVINISGASNIGITYTMFLTLN